MLSSGFLSFANHAGFLRAVEEVRGFHVTNTSGTPHSALECAVPSHRCPWYVWTSADSSVVHCVCVRRCGRHKLLVAVQCKPLATTFPHVSSLRQCEASVITHMGVRMRFSPAWRWSTTLSGCGRRPADICSAPNAVTQPLACSVRWLCPCNLSCTLITLLPLQILVTSERVSHG